MAATDATFVPRRNTAYRLYIPVLDADGDLVTGATGLDSEISKDGGTFADCTNEATEIATSSGMYFLDLTSTEMDADAVCVIIKTSTVGAKTTPVVLYTATRDIDDLAYPTTTGRSIDVDASGGVEVGSLQAGAITAAAIATDAIDADALADNAITAATFADNAITAAKLAADVTTELQSGLATAASLTTVEGKVDTIDTNVDSVLADTGTDGVVVATASKTGYALSAAGVDAILDDPLTELAAVPAAAPTLRQALQFLYMALRNKITTTATETKVHNDAGSAIATAAVSDDGTTFERAEYT